MTKEINVNNQEIYNALRILNKEAKEENYDFPYFILLDEANLSPMEYYWADFMKICDYYNTEQCNIKISDKEELLISKTLRFMATINLDYTTEILSPRLIDRSWIIKLPTTNYSLDNIGNYNPILEEISPLIRNNIFELLTNSNIQNNQLRRTVIDKFDKIQDKFKEKNIIFSPRTILMIQNYCLTVQHYNLMETNGNELVALDYAVAQKILPMINGQGEDYKELVDFLIRETDKMPISKKILENIKSNADKSGMDYYQFFSRY